MGLIQTEALYAPLKEKKLGSVAWTAEEAVAPDDDGIMAATATKTSEQTITEFEAQPPCARALTVKSTGTAGDIAAKAIVIYGTDINDQPISESITPTADTAINATTTRAFKSVSKVVIGKMDGAGANIKIGWADKYGLPFVSDGEILMYSLENGSVATAATITANAELAKNLVAFNTTSNGKTREIIVLA